MEISFDPAKSARNVADRGLPFELAVAFDWSSALVAQDARRDYGEPRFSAIGLIGDRLHVVVFTPRAQAVHVISLRKANQREVRRYAAQTRP